jgi:hypothetical protein
MAQVIYCDIEDCGQPANILITNMDNGDVQGFCNPHYAEMIMNLAVTMIPPDEMQAATQGSDEKKAKKGSGRAKSQPKVEKKSVPTADTDSSDK